MQEVVAPGSLEGPLAFSQPPILFSWYTHTSQRLLGSIFRGSFLFTSSVQPANSVYSALVVRLPSYQE